jgi:nitrate reductase assembly molybdenum cofactor insertion protein NarJ
MISGGLSSALNSTLNIPPDYLPVVIQYAQQQLLLMKQQPKDLANDGQDLPVN